MTYNKPEIVKLDSAVKAIQNTKKFPHQVQDNLPNQPLATIGAYEADE